MKNSEKILKNRTIVLGVTGSVAAVEDVRLARELRRRGAVVQAVMTDSACGIVHPDAITYATGRPVLLRCSGMVEHVTYCGIGGSADLLLIAPCTANTICKMAAGIDDTSVTTFATTAIGRGMPVVIVPAMHESMFHHPAVTESLLKLQSWGIVVVGPGFEENKAKFANIEEIILNVERGISERPLAGKKVLITSGACSEPVDDVRIMTTRSTGMMGRELALQAYRLGADVTVVHNSEFPCVENIRISTALEMREAVLTLCKERGIDIYVSAAAISDFAPVRYEGKIPSGSSLTIEFELLPKLLQDVITEYNPLTVAFKLGWDEEDKAESMLNAGVRMVVVNTPDVMGAESGTFTLLKEGLRTVVSGNKEEVAAAIWSAL